MIASSRYLCLDVLLAMCSFAWFKVYDIFVSIVLDVLLVVCCVLMTPFCLLEICQEQKLFRFPVFTRFLQFIRF
jgi:hypothetical protein